MKIADMYDSLGQKDVVDDLILFNSTQTLLANENLVKHIFPGALFQDLRTFYLFVVFSSPTSESILQKDRSN